MRARVKRVPLALPQSHGSRLIGAGERRSAAAPQSANRPTHSHVEGGARPGHVSMDQFFGCMPGGVRARVDVGRRGPTYGGPGHALEVPLSNDTPISAVSAETR
jgi:hypothetical protein